jgi:hypothetical protein
MIEYLHIPTIPEIVGFLRTPKGIALSLVVLAVVFNAVFLWSEVGVSTFNYNDQAFHLTATQQTAVAINQNADPTDYWLAQIDLGYSLFHYYQHFPQVFIAELDRFTSFFIPISRLFDLSGYLLLVLFPVSIYWAMYRFEFDGLAAGLAALVASLVSASGLFGIEYSSYVWGGNGLYTQLWAMFFLPLALAEVYRVMKGNGSWFWSVFLSVVVLLSNLIYGYILILSAILFIFLTPNKVEVISRSKKTVFVFILTAVVAAYFFIPSMLDIMYFNRSRWLDPIKYNSYGAIQTLTDLFTGKLFDAGRLPILTILFFIALIFVVSQWKKEQYRLLLVFSFFWLVVYFGPTTWGPFINLLPFNQTLQFHRFVAGFQIGGVMIIGAGLSLLWDWLKERYVKTDRVMMLMISFIFLIVLCPVFVDRMQYYQQNTQWKMSNYDATLLASKEITDIKDTFATLPPGRVYAGLPPDFGNDYRYKIGYVPMYSILPQLGIDTFGYAYTAFPLVSDVRLMFDNTRYEQYSLFNIRYVLLQKTWTPAYYYTKIEEFDRFDLYEVPTTGYFGIVDAPAVFYGKNTDFYYPNNKWLVSDLPLQKQNPILVIGDKPAETNGLPVFAFTEVNASILDRLSYVQPVGGVILNETIKVNEYTADFSTTRNSYLLLKTSYHPGWETRIDGELVTPVMLSPGFIGIPVTPGTHHAVVTYHPPFYREPLMMCGLFILIYLMFFNRMTDYILARFSERYRGG